jgi:AraC-like DNA-binding protein
MTVRHLLVRRVANRLPVDRRRRRRGAAASLKHDCFPCGLSARQLQRRFRRAGGPSPKGLARSLRFEAIRDRLMGDPGARLTDLAHAFGYADQAGFIRDFKGFAGRTPGEFAGETRSRRAVLRDHERVAFLQFSPPGPEWNGGGKGGGRP